MWFILVLNVQVSAFVVLFCLDSQACLWELLFDNALCVLILGEDCIFKVFCSSTSSLSLEHQVSLELRCSSALQVWAKCRESQRTQGFGCCSARTGVSFPQPLPPWYLRIAHISDLVADGQISSLSWTSVGTKTSGKRQDLAKCLILKTVVSFFN